MQIERSKTSTLRCCVKTAEPVGSARTALPGGRSAERRGGGGAAGLSGAGSGCPAGPAFLFAGLIATRHLN